MKEIEIFAFTFVAIISMIMLSNSTNHQICLLVGVLGFIMFVIYKNVDHLILIIDYLKRSLMN